MIIDTRGLTCPKPVLMTDEALSKMTNDILEILVDNEASLKNIQRYLKNKGYNYTESREDSYWRIKVFKGFDCNIIDEKTDIKNEIIIITTHALGRDEDLGMILMKSLFETMLVSKELPHTIFFMNTGVWLTTKNEEMVKIIRELEGHGVQIFSCGTCLKYYSLEEELKVGKRGGTNIILEGIKDFNKVIWI